MCHKLSLCERVNLTLDTKKNWAEVIIYASSLTFTASKHSLWSSRRIRSANRILKMLDSQQFEISMSSFISVGKNVPKEEFIKYTF